MSLDHNVYVGWYVEFDPCDEKVEDGFTTIKFCPTSKKHPTKDKFCSVCGEEIQSENKPQYRSYGSAFSLLNERDEKEIEYATLGHASLSDIENLKGSQAMFSHYPKDKTIIMAPGCLILSDISRSDGSVNEIETIPQKDESWVQNIIKVFRPKNFKIKFGAIHEVF